MSSYNRSRKKIKSGKSTRHNEGSARGFFQATVLPPLNLAVELDWEQAQLVLVNPPQIRKNCTGKQ
jgi:hypothetical protein